MFRNKVIKEFAPRNSLVIFYLKQSRKKTLTLSKTNLNVGNVSKKMNDNRAALVTGGASRVGRAITKGLAHAGFRVAVHYHGSHDEAESLQDELKAKIHLIRADLTKPRACEKVVQDAARALGRLDLLVNNAAIMVPDTADSIQLAKMKLINVDAPSKCIDAAREHLERTGGSVVNIADVAGYVHFKKCKAYSRGKSSIISLTLRKAIELAPVGVRVNGVCPGTVLPPYDYGNRRIASLIDAIPMKKIGRADDVAQAVVFFAQAGFVTGQTLAVDGGWLLRASDLRQQQNEQ